MVATASDMNSNRGHGAGPRVGRARPSLASRKAPPIATELPQQQHADGESKRANRAGGAATHGVRCPRPRLIARVA